MAVEILTNTENGEIQIKSNSDSFNAWHSIFESALNNMRQIIEKRLEQNPQPKDEYSMEVCDEYLHDIEMTLGRLDSEFLNHDSETDQKWFYQKNVDIEY